jgi:hypothetical protein
MNDLKKLSEVTGKAEEIDFDMGPYHALALELLIQIEQNTRK